MSPLCRQRTEAGAHRRTDPRLQRKHTESASSSDPKRALVSQTIGFPSSPSVLTPNHPAESKRELHKRFGCVSENPPGCWQALRDTWPCSRQPGRVNQQLLRIVHAPQRTVSFIKGLLFPAGWGHCHRAGPHVTQCPRPGDKAEQDPEGQTTTGK